MKNKEEKLQLFELVLGDDEMNDGVSTISFVEHPAHESNFMHFSKDKQIEYKFTEEGEKKIVTGAAIIPNIPIYRYDKQNDFEYEVVFKEDTIAKCQELFFKRAHQKNSNVEHMFALDGVTVVESWLVEDPKNDKSNALGFSDIKKGSWFISYKIDNDSLWNSIKSGDVKGFSIEGIFINEEITASMFSKETIETEEEVVVDRQEQIKEIINSDKSYDEMYDLIADIIKDEIDFEEEEN